MLTTSQTRASRGWLRFGGAILVLSVVAGCSSSGAGGSSSPAIASRASTAPTGSLPTVSPGPDAQLAAILRPLHAAATFETSVIVDGAVVVNAKGRSVGGSSRSTVTTGGRSVEYITIPPGAWARHGTGNWVSVVAAQAPVAPLDVLAHPVSLQADAADGSAFTATYPAAALGLEGDPLRVTILVNGATVTFSYAATTAGHPTASTTTIRPAPADPITAPS